MFFRFSSRFSSFRVLEIACLSLGACGATVCPARAQITVLPSPVNASGLRLQLDNEEPTFVYSESETLRTQTPIAWGLRTLNDLNLERKITLTWRVRDAFGRTWDSDREKLTISANGTIRRRQLFQPKTLGAYRIDVEARGERKGEDDIVRATFSFAVVAPPAPFLTATSPLSRPYFSLNSRAPRATNENSFLSRVGALGTPPSASELPPEMTMTLPYPQLESDNAQGSGEGANGEGANWHRTLSAAQKIAPVFAVRNEVVAGQRAISAASSLVKCGVLAKSVGASSVASRLPSPSSDADSRLTCAAAWSQMARLLENATSEGALFPDSPLVQSASFRVAATRNSTTRIAVLWNDGAQESSTRLTTRLAGARVLDIFGNEIARSDGDRLSIPLSRNPVYVLADVSSVQADNAWKSAQLEDYDPLGVQVLPFTQTVQSGNARDLTLRVRVQNVGIAPFAGTFRASLPKGWKLALDRQDLVLAPGETRVLNFSVAVSNANASGVYQVVTEAASGKKRWKWRQDARVATISRIENNAVNLDGTLNEWNSASWMTIDAAKTRAQVALFFDDANLYVGARVRENGLQARAQNAGEPFWRNDALQIAFGMRNEGDALPSANVFHDTDYGFLLAPESRNDGQLSGRVRRLWNPQNAFETMNDDANRVLDVPGARCVVTRDERNGITNYEATIPLSQIADLRPQNRMRIRQTVRFSWILHLSHSADGSENAAGDALEWSRANNVFPWWRNLGSLMPSSNLYLAAQVPIGFAPRSSDLPQMEPAATFETSTPRPSSTRTPIPAPVPTPNALPTPYQRPVQRPTPEPTPNATATPTQVLPPLPLPPSPDAQLPPAAPPIPNELPPNFQT